MLFHFKWFTSRLIFQRTIHVYKRKIGVPRMCTLLLKNYCVFLLMIPLFLVGGAIEKGISFSRDDLEFSEYRGYDVVRLKGCTPTVRIGEPELAVKPLLLLIPPDAVVSRVEIVSSEKAAVEGDFTILPTQYPQSFSLHEQLPFVVPKEEVYVLTTEYPGKLAEHTHTGTKGGYRIATITLYPLQYVPKQGRLFLYTDITFRVVYEEGKVVPETVWKKEYEYQREAVKNAVINPEDVEQWCPQVKECIRTRGSGERGPTFDNPEYAIMVADGFEPYFEPLRDWKTQKGVPTEIYLRDWILSNYSGRTDEEKVRNFIIDYQENHGTLYFLCVGDWGDFPMKQIYTYNTNTPTDFWYQDYDDDFYSDVYVGRASISNVTEAVTFVNKVLKYEKEISSEGFHEKIFLPGYELWVDYGNPESDTIAKYDPPSWLDAKRYSYLEFLSTQEITDTFNVGYGYTEISAHGEWNGWGEPGHHNADANALTNAPPRCGVCTAICCFIGKLDYSGGDCYVEHMMNNPNGGTVAFWGNTRKGYGKIENMGRSEWLDIWFYEELNDSNVYNIGRTCAASKDRSAPYASDAFVYHCMHSLTLFCDPEMPLWNTFPDSFEVSHDDQAPTGTSTFDVTVTGSDGDPIEGARVCLMCQQDTMYRVDYTEPSGVAGFSIDPEMDNDTMLITVTKVNYYCYEDKVPITRGLQGAIYDGDGGPLTAAGSPYYIVGDAWVPEFKSLTIDPGVEIYFESDYRITAYGILRGNGNVTGPIYLISRPALPDTNGLKLMTGLRLQKSGYFRLGQANGE